MTANFLSEDTVEPLARASNFLWTQVKALLGVVLSATRAAIPDGTWFFASYRKCKRYADIVHIILSRRP